MPQEVAAKAQAIWDAIPPQRQETLLRNVWCPNCAKMTTITDFTGRVETGDLVLTGTCAACGGRVARVIEDVHLRPPVSLANPSPNDKLNLESLNG